MIQVIAAPFDGGGAKHGTCLGPTSIRLAGLESALAQTGNPVAAWHDLENSPCDEMENGLRNFECFFKLNQQLHDKTYQALENGDFPICLGGEHSISMGSISAALASQPEESLAVIWIDAHPDLNQPATSRTGNLHGMPLALLGGLPSGVGGIAREQWSRLEKSLVPRYQLKFKNVAWIGLRDVDSAEADVINRSTGSLPITMHDIDVYGIAVELEKLEVWLKAQKIKRVWISFDVDVLDPLLAPGTGTAVRGGLTYREAHLIAELFWKMFAKEGCPFKFVGLDVVETNPLEDVSNTTAKMAVEWIASLFGKTILGRQN